MKRIFKYVGLYKVRMLIGLIIKAIGTVMDLAIPYILTHIIDNVIPTKDLTKIFIFGGVMLICCAIGFSFNVIANRMASYVAKNVTESLRHDLFNKMETLSMRQIDDVTMPSLVSRMTTDTYNIHHMVGMMQRMGVRAPILLIGGIIITFTMDKVLTLVLLSVLPFVTILTVSISKMSLPLFTKVQESLDHLVRIIRENVTGIRVIKALSKEEKEKERFDKVNKEVIDYELKSGYTMASLSPLMSLVLNIGLVIVIIVGAYRIKNEQTTAGIIISFTTYFTIILNAMRSITRIFVVLSRSNASAIRIDYIFNLKEDLMKEECFDSSNYEIEFRNVYFEYNEHKELEGLKDVNRYNLSNINFKLKKGESLGIIGATGSGKTTIINLLMRFYDVSDGSIFVKGKNVKEYDKQELRKMFGTSLQNDTIFNDTIKNNIAFYRDVTDEDILKASKTSQAFEFIDNLEEKFDSNLSAKGTNISGGQKQRIMIARALASNPEILILDDSSSALDYKTDSILRHELKENYKDITSIIITQRISSIINCDYIMMIDNGMVLGLGKHSELINSIDEYRSIYEVQMGATRSEVNSNER